MRKKEIVIKLPRTWETQVKIMTDSEIADYLYNVIRNGTVLPEHGRLIDADAYKKNLKWNENIDNAPTILEATGVEE